MLNIINLHSAFDGQVYPQLERHGFTALLCLPSLKLLQFGWFTNLFRSVALHMICRDAGVAIVSTFVGLFAASWSCKVCCQVSDVRCFCLMRCTAHMCRTLGPN
jgi:hypothetical protein